MNSTKINAVNLFIFLPPLVKFKIYKLIITQTGACGKVGS